MDIIHAWWIWVEVETHHKISWKKKQNKTKKKHRLLFIQVAKRHKVLSGSLQKHFITLKSWICKNVRSVCTSTSGITLITGTLSKRYSSNTKRNCFPIFYIYLLLAMSWEANCDDRRIFSTLKQRTIELKYIPYLYIEFSYIKGFTASSHVDWSLREGISKRGTLSMFFFVCFFLLLVGNEKLRLLNLCWEWEWS